jgi:hypothetical protein
VIVLVTAACVKGAFGVAGAIFDLDPPHRDQGRIAAVPEPLTLVVAR